MGRQPFPTVVILTLLALTLHAAALLGITTLRGSPTAYALQSPDSSEYLALARGLAFERRFIRLDNDRPDAGCPDTWRTPGYPLFLAALIRLIGDGPLRLLLAQQILAAAAVPLAWLIFRRFASPPWAMIAALAWALDPFRLYYSQWLLAETLFVVLLLIALLLFIRGRYLGWIGLRPFALGLLAGAIVLVRPIGLLLPLLAVLGIAWPAARHPRPHRRLLPLILCLFGAALPLGSWMARNRAVAGHFALSSQTGPSFAYHKVADVILWAQGLHDHRFDPEALDTVRTMIDRRLLEKWPQRVGPLTPQQRSDLTWTRLNFGRTRTVDPFVASSLLWEVGREMLAGRRAAMLACYAAQGAGMLVFPLGLIIDPPAGTASAPLSLIGGGSALSKALAVAIGSAYAALALAVLCRLIAAVWRHRYSAHLFALWPALTLFLPIMPFEDPRFRLLLIPLLWLLAVGNTTSSQERS
jgi:hypothetical protein